MYQVKWGKHQFYKTAALTKSMPMGMNTRASI